MNNSAFVFIKPHACNSKVQDLVKKGLEEKGFTIESEGDITAAEIDEKKLIDQHYYAIASKATMLKPHELNVPSEKFEATFGLSWEDALKSGNVYNAMDACEELGIDGTQMEKEWRKCKSTKKLVKFGGGFYCGLVAIEGKTPLYVFNGFFMSMRAKYVSEGAAIHYYVISWDSKKLSWEDFRGEALGPTDPSTAPADSLRGMIYTQWESLGLAAQPDTGDNGVHASASPFEALAERVNWLGADIKKDAFGKALLDAGVSLETINAWSVDPQVVYGPVPIKKSLFDSLEDIDSDECLARCQMINLKGKSGKKSCPVTNPLELGKMSSCEIAVHAAAITGIFLLGALIGRKTA